MTEERTRPEAEAEEAIPAEPGTETAQGSRAEPREGAPPALRGKEGHLEVSSMQMYTETRSAMAERRFGREDGQDYPAAALRSKGKVVGHAVMRPPETDEGYVDPDWLAEGVEEMWRLRDGLSDLDADVLDAMTAAWILQGPTDPARLARISVNRILEARGVKPKAGGQGRRGGYTPEQRQKVISAIGRVQTIVTEMEMDWPEDAPGGKTRMRRRRVQSRLVVITDAAVTQQPRLDGIGRYEGFRFRVGEAVETFLSLKAGRQAAQLALKALHYDPYRQIAEKRLTRGLSERWRNGASREGQYRRPFRVADLLRMAGLEEYQPGEPRRRKERLEKALDTLRADGVVAAWEYDHASFVNPMEQPRKGWDSLWQGSSVLIEPPELVKDVCDRIAEKGPRPERSRMRGISWAPPPRQPKSDIGERLRTWRERTGTSQRAAARQLTARGHSVSSAYLSYIERGKKDPAGELHGHIEALIGSGSDDKD